MVRYISSLVFFSSVAMWVSGLRISTPEGRSMSPAVISPGPVTTSGASISAASECMHAADDLLEVEDDVGHVLLHAVDRGELVRDALDPDARDGGAGQGRQQHSA